ncbi:LOW QUALITY PROTEIN: uncharacterized protein LOC143178963 [Calliopsis andreniformis]|uniref:LOW QUALITY PROTEIN: uncharacterized protein LOC143178963 n=1 Tax=Calliopsis andreniformis TaxID=337506 RepID=UPI003FCCF679
MQERRCTKMIYWMFNACEKKSMKAKAKTKKSNCKFGKVKFSTKEVAPVDPDLSQLSQPIDTSLSTLSRVSKVLENGSDEVKSILAYECDLIYECRICRSLFRSLVNFISHKRIYCKKKFNITFAKNSLTDYDTTFASNLNVQKLEEIPEENSGNDRILRSQVDKEQPRKDLTAVVNMLQKKQIENLQTNTERLCLETVQSNSSAVYQTVEPVVSTQSYTDLMKTQVVELKDMINGQVGVLGPNGQLIQPSQKLKTDSVTEDNSNKDTSNIPETELTCSICGAKFSTRKTLSVHTRTLHTAHRLFYPCPCCSSTFANSWSTYRHLFKVHRKSNDQVRKLRAQIQEKAFFKDTTVAEDLQKEDANKILLHNALRVNETQEWMDHLESDSELQRCGGCGKRFDRKAALSSHSQYCHRRVAACESTTKVKKTNKLPPCVVNETEPVVMENQNELPDVQNSVSVEINNTNEMSIRVETVSTLSKADWELLGEEATSQSTSNGDEPVVTNGVKENAIRRNGSPASDNSDPLEIVYTSINKQKNNIGSRKRKNKDSAKKLITNTGNNVTPPPWNASSKITVEQEAEVEKLDYPLAMEKKVASMVNIQKLQCLPCNRKFTSVTNLRRHAAIHIGWNRYQCKLCNFKCFDKCDCVAHCNKLHNAQNNRVIIEDMITQIPENQCTSDAIQNEVLTINNVEKQFPVPKAVEIRNIEPEIQIEEKIVDEAEEEIEDVNPVVLEEIVNVSDDTEENISNDIKNQNMLGLDPDLRRMVMEVIFGSSETNSAKQGQTKEAMFLEDTNPKIKNKEDAETESDLRECNTSVQDNPKPQRPIRNKIKRLNKDFIYDLKEVAFRKDPLIMKSFNKSLARKTVVPEEDKDKDLEQPSKRFKPLQNNGVSILCEKIDECNIDLESENLKGRLTFSQCHS